MKQISKYVKIREISVQNPNSKCKTCFEVEMITKYEILLFGHIINTKTTSKIVPFRFKTLEIAKDYCEVNPDMVAGPSTYKKTVELQTGLQTITYKTYEIYKNDKKNSICKMD